LYRLSADGTAVHQTGRTNVLFHRHRQAVGLGSAGPPLRGCELQAKSSFEFKTPGNTHLGHNRIGQPAGVPPEAIQRVPMPSALLTTLVLDKWDEIG